MLLHHRARVDGVLFPSFSRPASGAGQTAQAQIALWTLCRWPQLRANEIDEQEGDAGIEQCLAKTLPDAKRGADHRCGSEHEQSNLEPPHHLLLSTALLPHLFGGLKDARASLLSRILSRLRLRVSDDREHS
jgi:hypothetical protein